MGGSEGDGTGADIPEGGSAAGHEDIFAEGRDDDVPHTRPLFRADIADIEEAYRRFQKERDQGASQEAIILALKEQDFSILDAMKVVKHVYGVSLGEAKQLVTSHPAWSRESKIMDQLHTAMLDAIQNP